MSITAASWKSLPMTSKDTPNATFSLESPDGVSPSPSPGGRKTAKSGQAPARVSRFRALDSEKAMPTNDTCGPLFTRSSPSAALQSCLASRLQARMDLNGSPEYALTWKEQDMPAGVPIYRLRASARRTSGNVSSGWPTPNDTDGTGAGSEGRAGGDNLQTAAQLTGWPTCSARDHKDTPGMSETGINPDGSERSRLDQLPRVANLCGWVSPTAQDASRGSLPPRPQDTGIPLSQQVATLAGWPTPQVHQGPNNSENRGINHGGRRPRETPQNVQDLIGQDLKLSPAETENSAASPQRLNPYFSSYLMGFPTSWVVAGIRSLNKSRKK